MALVARVLGVSLLTSALVTGLGIVLIKLLSDQTLMPWTERPIAPGDRLFLAFLACVGGVIGAVAGAAREVVAATRPVPDRVSGRAAQPNAGKPADSGV